MQLSLQRLHKLPYIGLAGCTGLILILCLTACAPVVTASQSLNTTYGMLTPGQSFGQTFVAPHDGLSGVELYLAPADAGSGTLVLHVLSEPGAEDDLVSARLLLDTVSAPGFYRFSFDPLENSRRQYYYAYLELKGEGSVQVGLAWDYTYLDGSFYQDHIPSSSQMTFSLEFDRWTAITGTAKQAASWLGMLLMGIFLYILPGWAVMKVSWRGWDEFNWVEKAALSAGISLAMIPVFFLWTDVLGLHLGSVYAWLPGIIALLTLIWVNRFRIRSIRFGKRVETVQAERLSRLLPDVVLVIVMATVLVVRLWSVRNLDLPMWGDSYQHTVLTQLLLDQGGLFDSWEPYAPLESLTYHYGFHADTAVFGWLAGLPATRAILWVGQLFNTLAVLAVYPFAVRLGNHRWAGVAAVLLAGLLFPVPMTYVNWGRYTQLAGQTILPAFALLFLLVFKSGKLDWAKMGVLAVTLSGLALTHYRILILAMVIFPAFLFLEVRRANFKAFIGRMAVLGLGSGVLFLPWLIRVFGARILAILQTQLTTLPASNSTGLNEYNAIGDIFAYLPAWSWLLLPVMIGVGLWLRKGGVAFIALWWFLILLAANPAWLNLPGTGTLSNFAVFISAYIPAAIILGAGVGWIFEKRPQLERYAGGWITVIFVLALLGSSVWGARQRLADIRTNVYSLAARPDLQAADWIRENTPSDAKFVVNYFFAYIDQLIVGSDGGWWLPLLTQRQTNLPPLTYGIEDSGGDEYLYKTNELGLDIYKDGITDPGIIERLDAMGFGYIYIGQRQGKVNNPDPVVLDPEVLSADPHFELVYHRDLVWIFMINP